MKKCINPSPKTKLLPSTLKTASVNESENSEDLNANVHLSPFRSLINVSCTFCYQYTLFVVLLWVTAVVTQPIVMQLFEYRFINFKTFRNANKKPQFYLKKNSSNF